MNRRSSNRTDFPQAINRLLALAVSPGGDVALLTETLNEALAMVGGSRAFLARIEQESGQLSVISVAGPGWTDMNRELRLEIHNETQRGITGYVALTGKPYVTADVRSDPHYLEFFPDVISEVAVPFFDSEGRVRGVLNVESDKPAAFDDEAVRELSTFAGIAAATITLEEARNRERMLIDIGMDLAAVVEIEPLMRKAVKLTSDVLGCEACSAFLIDDTTQRLVLQASSSRLKEQVGVASYALGEGLTGTVGRTGETIRLMNPRDDPRWRGRYGEYDSEMLGAFMAVPIVGRDRILGVLRALMGRSAWYEPSFTVNDERVMLTVASQLGVAIENVRNSERVVRSERMAAWGELSAKSAHMIGNRSFAIKGDLNELKYLLEQLRQTRKLPEPEELEITALVDSIEKGLYRLDEILREFRDFVVATQLTIQETDVTQIVREAVAETVPRRTKLTLTEEYAPELPPVRCDPGRLKRALSELVENAVSFQPDGGELKVSTALIEAGKGPMEARLSPSRAYVRIAVEDCGPGVPDDLKEKIFTPFYTSRVKGMGLGLSIVKGIVDAHRGVIHETGESGKGARFQIYLPVDGEKR